MSETQTEGQTEGQNAEKAPKAPGVGDLAKDLIRAGKTNEQVLEAVREKFPDAKTSMASINWYRNKLRGDGETVPTARELKADSKAEAKAAKQKAKDEAKAAKQAERDAAKAAKAEQKAAEKAAKQAEKAKPADGEAKAGEPGFLE